VFTVRYELNLYIIIKVRVGVQGCAMAQAVILRFVTAEGHVQSQLHPCEICGGQMGNGTGFSAKNSSARCFFQ